MDKLMTPNSSRPVCLIMMISFSLSNKRVLFGIERLVHFCECNLLGDGVDEHDDKEEETL